MPTKIWVVVHGNFADGASGVKKSIKLLFDTEAEAQAAAATLAKRLNCYKRIKNGFAGFNHAYYICIESYIKEGKDD